MSVRGALIAGMVAAFAAAPAFAQPPADPIDALLKRKPAPIDPEEPDTAAAGSSAVEPDAPTRQTVQPRRPPLTAPVRIEEAGKSPDGALSDADLAYNLRLRSSAASAQAYQGPMDGGWTLMAADRELYVLQLIDRNGAVQGAWRDPHRAGALDASGFIDLAERTGGDLTLRFAAGAVAVLHAAGDGRLAGELTEGGKTVAVSLRRRNP